jgi:hypothetical protein
VKGRKAIYICTNKTELQFLGSKLCRDEALMKLLKGSLYIQDTPFQTMSSLFTELQIMYATDDVELGMFLKLENYGPG